MKLLQNKDNVTAPDATYPFGTMRDRALGTPGSKVNTEFMTDYVQFFEKMFAESGLTANGLPDNATNGFQLVEAAQIVLKGYKVYSGFLSQNGTNAPVFTSVVNEIGNISWSRTSTGNYLGTLTGAFPGTTICMVGTHDRGLINFDKSDVNSVDLQTKDFGTVLQDGILTPAVFIEIRMYL